MQVTEQQNPGEKPPYIRPNHYVGKHGLRAEKIIFDYDLAYFPGAALKYILRAGNKPGVSKREDYKKAIDCLKMAAEWPECRRTGRTIFMEQTGSYLHLDAVRSKQIKHNFDVPIEIMTEIMFMLQEIETCGEILNETIENLKIAIDGELKALSANTAEVCS